MSEPLASIVIPCFNRAQLVGRAIESALAQGPDCEVIVVDDGSTDGSAEVIASFPEVRTISTANSGVSAARNLGVSQAKAANIKFLDSDDTLTPCAVRALLAEAQQLPKNQIPFGRAQAVAEDGEALAQPGYGYPAIRAGEAVSLRELLSGIMSPLLPLYPRAALMQAGGFDPRLSLGEDHHLAVRLHQAGYRFVASDTLVCLVTHHGETRLSRLPARLQAERTLQQWEAVRAALGPELRSGSPEATVLAQRIWIDARDAARGGAEEGASKLFAFARELSPAASAGAPLPLRSLYRLMPPVVAERWLETVKSLRTRLSPA